jgi:hypothetical protein
MSDEANKLAAVQRPEGNVERAPDEPDVDESSNLKQDPVDITD